MALFLVQHGKNLPEEDDPDQGLSPEGKFEVERMAALAKKNGVKVARIYHSGKTRARQTAGIMGVILQPPQGVEERAGLAPLAEVIPVAGALATRDNVMLVGHLPFLAKLAALLLTGSEERPVVKFQHGGILCLDQEADGAWLIRWALMPRMDSSP
jgi:phosphohistidine phosphatase